VLTGNRITGTFPSEFGRLTGLVELDMFANPMDKQPMPDFFGNMANLTYLDLHSTYLTGSIHSSIYSLPKLRVLELGENQLTGAIDPSIGESLPELAVFFAQDNLLTGTLPLSLISPQLTNLAVSDNHLSGSLATYPFETPLYNMLFLANNRFHGNMPWFAGPTSRNMDVVPGEAFTNYYVRDGESCANNARSFCSSGSNMCGSNAICCKASTSVLQGKIL
jgi:Leucine-rich repeat (LRR) protein